MASNNITTMQKAQQWFLCVGELGDLGVSLLINKFYFLKKKFIPYVSEYNNRGKSFAITDLDG